jgi:ABC-type proline/glycine betaine transport system permease subunit
MFTNNAFPALADWGWAGRIDALIWYLNLHYSTAFNLLKNILLYYINFIQNLLEFLPWWLLLLVVAVAGRRLRGSWKQGIFFAGLLSFIGLAGYWRMMNETLAIVLASVSISLVLGFPAGILLSMVEDKYFLPLLDAMQTMPTFVYMIPAVMLLGPGKVPAVLATVIYAVVPVIRLTSHGLRQVDPAVVEAAQSFGSTRGQLLWKVLLPQARATIMTGVNQTLLMAVAMVVTCSMIGANGLGMEVLIAINRTESGRGLIAGLCIVIIAILLDRLTQGLGARKGGSL